MAKQEIDRHVDTPQVSFTLLVDEPDMKAIERISKEEVRTKGYLVRVAIKKYLSGRKK